MDEFQGCLYIVAMLGHRFRIARVAKGLSLREVGEAVNVSPQAVAQWEKSNPKFGIDKTHLIANLLDVDINWLEGRFGEDGIVERSKMFNKLHGKVPLISIHHAILIAPFARTDFASIPYTETVEPSARIVGQGYAVRVKGYSSFLEIHTNDILILDNGAQPRSGDIVLAIDLKGEYVRTVFARYIGAKGDPQGGPVLLGDVEDMSDEFIQDDGRLKPIAVVVEHRRLRSEEAST